MDPQATLRRIIDAAPPPWFMCKQVECPDCHGDAHTVESDERS